MFHESREKCPLSVPNLGERKRTHRLPFGEDGFVSTSIDLNYEGRFGGNSPGKTVMYIDVPAGARAAYIAGLNDDYKKQQELLLDKGTKFRIISAGKRMAGYHNGKPVEELFIHAEVIP